MPDYRGTALEFKGLPSTAKKKKKEELKKEDPYGLTFGPPEFTKWQSEDGKPASTGQPKYKSSTLFKAESDKRKEKLLSIPAVATPSTEGMSKTPGTPVSALTPYNVWLSATDVNKKVEQITKAHTEVTGVPPSPGLVKDLLTADPVITKAAVSYRDMFTRSNMPKAAWQKLQIQSLMDQAKYLGEHGFGHGPGFPGVDREDWDVPGLYTTHAAYDSPAYKKVVQYNQAIVAAHRGAPEGMAGVLGGDLSALNPLKFAEALSVTGMLKSVGVPDRVAKGVGAIMPSQLLLNVMDGAIQKAPERLDPTGGVVSSLVGQQLSPVTDAVTEGPLGRPLHDTLNAVNQIRQSLLDTPQGVIMMVGAIGADALSAPDVTDLITGKASLHDFIPKRTVGMVGGMGHQIKEDILHPEANAGYLAMDVFGAASLGLGFATRLSTAGRLAGAAREAAAAGDISRIPTGYISRYRPAKATPVDLGGDLQGLQYYETQTEAARAAGGGPTVRVTLPADEVTAFSKTPGMPEPLFPVEPPIAEGQARLYRGQGTGEAPKNVPDWMKENQGRWFTTDKTVAERYGSDLHYVDVPEGAVEGMRVSGGGGPGEVLLPESMMEGVQRLGVGEKPPIYMPTTLETEAIKAPGAIRSGTYITGQALKGLLSRPVGGSGIYGFGETSVVVPYFDNAIARYVQKGYLKLTFDRLQKRQLDGEYIFGNSFLDHIFAPEKTFKSKMTMQQELDMAIQMAPALALQRMQRWDNSAKQILRDALTQPKLLPSFLSLSSEEQLGIETAIRMLATDTVDPIQNWRVFHQNQIDSFQATIDNLETAGIENTRYTPAQFKNVIDLNKYYIGGHKASLKALDLAVKVLQKDNPRLEEIYLQAVRVAHKRNDFQRTTMGMDDRTMDQAVAAVRHQLQGREVGFTPQEGKFVIPHGVEPWDEAENAFAAAQTRYQEARDKLRSHRADSLTKAETAARRAKEDRLQQAVDVALEQVDETQAALNRLGPRPSNIPITRTVLGEQEASQRAVELLNKAVAETPNNDLQTAIQFLQQGELNSNVAAYLGHILDRWDLGGFTEDPANWGALGYIEDAIDQLGGVPIEELLYGEYRETRTPGGRLRQEYRSLEAKILQAEREGRFAEDLPVFPEWVAINERLGLDHTARGSLLPEEPAKLKEFMDQAGEHVVKSDRQAHALIQDAEEELRAIEAEGTPVQDRIDRYRELEQQVFDAERRADEEHGPPDPSETVFFAPGMPEWADWAERRFTPDEIQAMREFIELNNQVGLQPWFENDFRVGMSTEGNFNGSLIGNSLRSDTDYAEIIRGSAAEEGTWGGVPMDVARRDINLRIEEANAYLAGDMDAALRAKAEQIAINEQWYNDDPNMPHTTAVSDEELTQRARDATVSGEEQRANARIEEMRKQFGSFQIPQRREIYRDKPRFTRYRQRLTATGFKPPRDPDSHRHNTGAAINAGDARLDTSNLLLEQWGDVLRLGSAQKQYRDLFRSHEEGGPAWDAETNPDFVRTKYHKPIRDMQDAPKRLREAMAALERLDSINPKDLARARDTMEEFATWFYPDPSEVEAILASGGKVRWVDERFITETPMGLNVDKWRAVDQTAGNIMSVPNEAWRLMLLFSSPAYALNALGSSMLLLTKQGFLAPVNYGRALASRHIYGDEVTRILDAMAGNTHAMSYLPDTERNLFTALSRVVTDAWQTLTDTHFRRAAVIHELRRRGLLKDDLSPQEMADQLMSSDPEVKRLVTEATQAGRNGMLNFNKMSWPEKAIARHLFFIYSFMRASAAYTFHYLFEHPAQHAALTALGRDREDMIKKLIGDNLPQWFYDQGYIPIGPGEVINPNQMNMAATLNQLANPLQSMFMETPYADMSGFLQGGPTLAMEMITGKSTTTGKKLKHGNILGSLIDMYYRTPIGRTQTRIDQIDDRQVPIPMRVGAASTDPIEAAMASERDAVNMPSFQVHGWWDTWGRFLGRSAVPLHPNVPALQAKYWKQQAKDNPEAYAQHELEQVQAMVTAQGHVLGREAPQEVRSAVDFVARYTQHMNDWREGKVKGMQPPKDPNAKMEAYETIRWMHEQKLISTDEFRKRVGKIRDKSASQSEAQRQKIGALWEIAGKPWQNWNDQVKQVDFFNHEDYPVVLQRLSKDDVGDYTDSSKATQADKWQYGRAAFKFGTQLQKMRLEASALPRGDERTAAQDKIRAFEDRHSKPVTIGDHVFPPLTLAAVPQLSYGRLTEQGRKDWQITRDLRSWSSLASWEKQVLDGEARDPMVDLGWSVVNGWLANARKTLQPGQRLPSGSRKWYGDAMAKQNPAFAKDWEKANQPLAQRMLSFKSIQNSRYRDEWVGMVGGIASWANAAYKNGWTAAQLGQSWKQQVPELEAWIARQETGFRAEVQTYVKANPNFLVRLVKP